ncbi:MAG: ABC transporter permease [Pseudomonadota bacterium]
MSRLRPTRLRRAAAVVWLVLIYVFLLSPLVVIVGASFNGGERTYVNFPPTDVSIKWYGRIEATQVHSLGLSLALALTAAGLGCLVGVPAAIGVVRANFPGKAVVSAMFRAPLQIPTVVIGVSFLQLYYLVGDFTGLYAIGNFYGLLIAHTFMATPYVVGAVGAILQRFNQRLEEAAFSLGASPWSTFRRVTLPLITPGVYAGALYAFMISFADLPVSMFLSGPDYKTFPVQLFHAMEYDFSPSFLALSTLIILFSLAALVSIQKVVGLNALLRSSGN